MLTNTGKDNILLFMRFGKIIAVTLLLVLPLVFVTEVQGATKKVTPVKQVVAPSPSPSASPVSTESPRPISSFEIFWPLVAGRTESESFYSLKLLKETVGGWLVFGDTKKADYAILLGTKRMLEADKLIGEGKTGLAAKALERAASQYDSAYNYMKSADKKREFKAEDIKKGRLINAKSLINSLSASAPSGEVQTRLNIVKEKIDALLRDYLVKHINSEFSIGQSAIVI